MRTPIQVLRGALEDAISALDELERDYAKLEEECDGLRDQNDAQEAEIKSLSADLDKAQEART